MSINLREKDNYILLLLRIEYNHALYYDRNKEFRPNMCGEREERKMSIDELLGEIIAILRRNKNTTFLRAALTRIRILEKTIK